MSDSIPQDSATLPGDARMPLLGFGTWQITGDDARRSVLTALDAGYRHLDTATVYGNEAEVGAGLAESGVAREDVFITTKVPPHDAGTAKATLDASLDGLRTDHVDLWLIHWVGEDGAAVSLWREMLEERTQGRTRSIGVSNYSLDQIDELQRETGELPTVNQIRWSPLLFDKTVLDGHQERGIVLEGYSALRGGTLEHPVVGAVAERHGRTPAQVIVRWHLQHGVVVIPKSTKEERIRSNAQVGDFELSGQDMAELDALGEG